MPKTTAPLESDKYFYLQKEYNKQQEHVRKLEKELQRLQDAIRTSAFEMTKRADYDHQLKLLPGITQVDSTIYYHTCFVWRTAAGILLNMLPPGSTIMEAASQAVKNQA